MTVKEFIENYVDHNAMVRLWIYNQDDSCHEMLCCGHHEVAMAWEVTTGKGFLSKYADCKFVEVTSIGCDSYPEAISIVIDLEAD